MNYQKIIVYAIIFLCSFNMMDAGDKSVTIRVDDQAIKVRFTDNSNNSVEEINEKLTAKSALALFYPNENYTNTTLKKFALTMFNMLNTLTSKKKLTFSEALLDTADIKRYEKTISKVIQKGERVMTDSPLNIIKEHITFIQKSNKRKSHFNTYKPIGLWVLTFEELSNE